MGLTMESAKRTAEAIKIGWNLGNALDCCGLGNVKKTRAQAKEYESQWGNPTVSRKLIQKIKGYGFGAIRIPVTWFEHMDEEGIVDLDWMRYVKSVIDLVLEEDLYCIVNVHHDTGAGTQAWLRADSSVYQREAARFEKLWEQIAAYFSEYGERLLFEGFNEMLDTDSSWDYTTEDGYDCINRYNQLFVNTVRKSGGNNKCRNLLLNTYGASPMSPAADHFVVPNDGEKDHLIVGVHFYKPDAFSAGDMELFTEEAKQEINDFTERMKAHFLDKGIPVILGECGTHDIRAEKERAKYAEFVIREAIENGMAYFWWDDGGAMKLVDRSNGDASWPKLVCSIQQAAVGGRKTSDTNHCLEKQK